MSSIGARSDEHDDCAIGIDDGNLAVSVLHSETPPAEISPRPFGEFPAGIGPLESEFVGRVRLLSREIFYCGAPAVSQKSRDFCRLFARSSTWAMPVKSVTAPTRSTKEGAQ